MCGGSLQLLGILFKQVSLSVKFFLFTLVHIHIPIKAVLSKCGLIVNDIPLIKLQMQFLTG